MAPVALKILADVLRWFESAQSQRPSLIWKTTTRQAPFTARAYANPQRR